MALLPDDFEHPLRAEMPSGNHLRPMSGADTELDYAAVMASRERLWLQYKEAWGWPREEMTFEEDRADLDHHAEEIAAHKSFLYGVYDAAEEKQFGCVYIDPPYENSPPGTGAVSSWWVVDEVAGTAVETELDEFVPAWLAEAWPLEQIHFYPSATGR